MSAQSTPMLRQNFSTELHNAHALEFVEWLRSLCCNTSRDRHNAHVNAYRAHRAWLREAFPFRSKDRHDGHVQERAAMARAWLAPHVVEEGECLLWTRGVNSSGTPTYRIEGVPGVTVRRWVYERTQGPIAPGMEIIPMCRNQRCLSEKCLQQGTRGDRVRIDSQRGSYSRTSARAASTAARRARSSVTIEMAREARRLRGAGFSLREVAQQVGLDYWATCRICRGETWQEAANGASVFNWRPAA